MIFSILSIIDIQQNLYGCFAASKPTFSKDDKSQRKDYWNLSSFLVPSLAMLWPNIMNVSYECSEFITAKSHLINFLWVIKHWRKLMKFAWDLSSKLTDGRFEHPARSSDNSVIDRMAAVSGGGIWGSEPHQINMGGWENFFVVTQKWDEDSARIKKQTLAYWESRAKVWMNFVWYFPIMIFFRNAPE